MRLTECAYNDIKAIHKIVFDEELDIAAVSNKRKKGELKFFLLQDKSADIGYISLQAREKNCHIWLTGLLPKYRGKGYGKQLFTVFEEYAKKNKFFRISMSTLNHRREMLALAIKNGYRIIKTDKSGYGDNIKIRLEKQISNKNELRILLTEKCNYKCFFCHSEGLDADANYSLKDKESILESIKSALKLGYNDITFTGGEPLIRNSELIWLIQKINAFKFRPKLTVVTNGYLIKDDLIKTVKKYKGEFKFNVSMHSLDSQIYSKITKSSAGNFNVVMENIKLLVSNNIDVKLNSVMLKNLNTNPLILERYLRKSADLGVKSVKLLELLIIKETEEFYNRFFSSESIQIELKKLSFTEKSRNLRGSVLSHEKYNNMDIEVMKLTCSLGCSKCMDVRDRTLGPDLNYYPCFVQSANPVNINSKTNMLSAFEKGNKIIKSYAAKYGNDSPLLISKEKYLKSRSELFFTTVLTFEQCRNILESSGFQYSKRRAFKLFFYMPLSPAQEWLGFEKVLKIGFDNHTPNKIEFVYSRYKYFIGMDGSFLTEQTFLNDIHPPYVDSLQKAQAIMEALDYKEYFQYRFEFADYSSGDLQISLDIKSEVVNFKVSFQDYQNDAAKNILRKLQAKAITIPFTKWLMDQNRIV